MKAKDYVKRVNDAGGTVDAIVQVIVDLMREINPLMESRGARHSPRVIAATILEINQKWKSIHRQLNLPEAVRNQFVDACIREWPILDRLIKSK
jgi:hypothetical protein